MGTVQQNRFKLSNPTKSDLNPIEVESRIDMDANYLCIPEHIAIQLDLEESEKRELILIDGTRFEAPYTGPIKIQFGNRSCYTGALIIGDEVIMGRIPITDLDLAVSQDFKIKGVKPLSTNLPGSVARDVRQS